MARKKFHDLTPVEKYVRLRKQGHSFIACKWISILSPYLVIGIINFEDYFQEANGIKMSLGCILALIVAGISIKNETKENKKINGIVTWAVAFALIFFFQSILQDLLLIVGAGLIGQIVGAGFELGADIQLEKANIYRNATIQAESFKNIEV
jgi:FtsH-binding integral membrane protein